MNESVMNNTSETNWERIDALTDETIDTSMNNTSETNWERIDALTDETIDTSDIPPLDESFFQRASLRLPQRRMTVTMQVDPDILAWFQSQGADWEQRMHAALRIYVEAHRTQQSST